MDNQKLLSLCWFFNTIFRLKLLFSCSDVFVTDSRKANAAFPTKVCYSVMN